MTTQPSDYALAHSLVTLLEKGVEFMALQASGGLHKIIEDNRRLSLLGDAVRRMLVLVGRLSSMFQFLLAGIYTAIAYSNV